MCASRAAFSRSILAVAATLSAGLAAPAMAQGFAPGMTLFESPVGQTWSSPPSLSEDGTTLGSEYFNPGGGFTVTGVVVRPDGRTVFSTPSRVDDISDNGAFTVEYAMRRDASGTPLSLLPGVIQPSTYSFESRISGDGNVVAGTRQDQPDWPTQAFRWTPGGGSQYIGPYRTDALYTNVIGISRDGSTVVGMGQLFIGSQIQPWKWTENSGFTILPTLPDARPNASSEARACNFDGSIIVGYDSLPVFGARPLVWTNGVPAALPILDGFRSCMLSDLSDDGSIIIGTHAASQVGLPTTIAIWTTAGGWVPALDFFRQRGIDVPSYLRAAGSFEVSADGQTFAARLEDTRDGRTYLATFVIPSPNGLALLVLSTAFARRSRGRR